MADAEPTGEKRSSLAQISPANTLAEMVRTREEERNTHKHTVFWQSFLSPSSFLFLTLLPPTQIKLLGSDKDNSFLNAMTAKKKANKAAFCVTLDPTAAFVCQPQPEIFIADDGPRPVYQGELLEAADLFEFRKPDGSPLKLTPLQTAVRNDLLAHAYNVLYEPSFSAGAGRLVLGSNGATRTTTLLAAQAILSALLPNQHIVFFCSAAQHPDVFAVFQQASCVRRPATDAADASWKTADDLRRALRDSHGRFVAFVDEFQAAYARETAWRDTAHSFGQQTSHGTFILTGSAPSLRALAFGHAAVEDVRGVYPYYGRVGNLNSSRYSVITMGAATDAGTVMHQARQ